MGHLAGHHIDLIRMGGRDNHIGILCAGTRQNIWIAGKANNALHIQSISRTAHEIRVAINNCHVIFFIGEMTRDLPANLTSSAYNHFHGWCPLEIRRTLPDGVSDRMQKVNSFLHSASSCASRPPLRFEVTTPSDLSLRCSAERSIPTKLAVRLILPPKRLIWVKRYSRSNSSRASRNE